MDIAQLRTFIAAAETGSFLAAASAVHASASSVTERIAALENRLGARLFDRSRKGCRLTPVGEGFLPRAQAIAAIWNISCTQARVPPHFTDQARIGGQFSLWPAFLINWAERLQAHQPSWALSLVAGSATRLNRDLANGLLDLAILYSPLFGPLMDSQAIFTDRLVLVRSARLKDWRENWVDIDWGADAQEMIATAVGQGAVAGVRLDFGGLAIRWLEDCDAAAYVPERLAQSALAQGSVKRVAGMPSFDFPIHAVWPKAKSALAAPLVASLVDHISTPAPDGPRDTGDGRQRQSTLSAPA